MSSVGQMTLCFAEVIVFAILVILALFIKEKVLLVIFVFSIISTILIDVLIDKENIELKDINQEDTMLVIGEKKAGVQYKKRVCAYAIVERNEAKI